MFHHWFHYLYREFGVWLPLVRETSYLGLVVISMLVSYVIPIPEAVFLLLVGFIASTGKMHIAVVLVLVYVGVVVGDNMLYRLTFFGNRFVLKFNARIRQSKLIKYEHLVENNIVKTIYFLRLIVGVRFFGPVISGTLGIPWKKFFLANAGASLVHTLFFVLLGYFSGKKILFIVAEVEIIRHILLFASPFIVATILGIYNQRNKKTNSVSV